MFGSITYCCLSFTGTQVSVWVLGSSIVKHAFVHARSRPGGIHLGLCRLNVSILWQVRSGMSYKDILRLLKKLLEFEDHPHILVIHCAGNDIGKEPIGILRNKLKAVLSSVARLLLHTLLIWSQILPRLKWRYSDNNTAMDRCRLRLNSSIASHILKLGGKYIRYPDITPRSELLSSDLVHLTPLGNDIFLNIMQGALEYFLTRPASNTFPGSL